jgi:tripartite-type tricarboxylate transporter receptor subunit TctC
VIANWRHRGIALLVALLTGVSTVHAQDVRQDVKYPTKKITFVVAFAAGGFADTLARFVAQKLNEKLGQPVVIENRAGAGGNTAARAVRSAEPDGYTVLVTTTALAINATMYRHLDLSLDQLSTVAISAASPETLAAHPSKAPAGLKEFLAFAENRQITFGSAGVGSGSHLAAEYFFKVHAKVKALHVPFRGGALAVQAVLGDQIDLVASSFGVNAQVNDGLLKGLAVASPERNPAMPQVPSYTEAGFPFIAESWVGFFVPAGTSSAIVATLNAAINEAVSGKAGRDHLTTLGFQVTPRSAAESQDYLKSEVTKWGDMVRTVNIYVD